MITNIFNNVKVSTKLMWFLVVPVVFMLLFSSLTILEKMEQRNNAIHSQQFIEVSLLLANLVNELQKERGFSAGFVESEGVRFDKELEEQRKLTDGKLELFNVSFRQYIQKYRDLNQTGGFEHIEERLQQLTGVRAMVDDLGEIGKSVV